MTKIQNLKVKTQNHNSKVKTELFFAMNKFLVLSCSFYFLLLSFKFLRNNNEEIRITNENEIPKLKYPITKDWTFKNWKFYLKFGFRICEVSFLEKLTCYYF
jgi:hypothetical protein